MQQVFSYRANKILFNFLQSNHLQGEVILPANICHDVVETLLYAGYTLQFVDIDAHTLCLNWTQVLPLAKDVCAILFVHTYGVEDTYFDFFDAVRKENPKIAIIDDRCLCFPCLDLVQTDADLVLYSTGEKKQVDLGVGGIGYVADGWKYEDIHVLENVVLKNETWTPNKVEIEKKMDAVIAHKEKLNAIYRRNIVKRYRLPDSYQHWRFNIIVPNKGEVLKAIFDSGLFASGHYAVQGGDCPIATNLHMIVINLFNDFYYTEEQAQKTCDVILKVLQRNR